MNNNNNKNNNNISSTKFSNNTIRSLLGQLLLLPKLDMPRTVLLFLVVQVLSLVLQRRNFVQNTVYPQQLNNSNNNNTNDCSTNNNTTITVADSRSLSDAIRQESKISNNPVTTTTSDKTAIVCSIVKRETPYIDEWIDYNLGIGFSAIHIYDNSDRYELEQWGIKQKQVANRPIYVQHYKGEKRQCEAYYDCARNALRNNVTWALFYDVDEFLVVKNFSSSSSTSTSSNPYLFNVIDFAEKYIPQGSLSLNFEVFGTAGKQAYEPIPVLKRFQYKVPRDYKMNAFVKSFVKLHDMDLTAGCLNPHRFPLRNGTYQTLTNNKTTFGAFNAIDTTDVASIYHYLFKSYEEYISKRSRGDVFYGSRGVSISEEWAINNIGPDQKPIPYGTIYDDTAWRILTTVQPKYKLYDTFTSDLQKSDATLLIPFQGILNNTSQDAPKEIQDLATNFKNTTTIN